MADKNLMNLLLNLNVDSLKTAHLGQNPELGMEDINATMEQGLIENYMYEVMDIDQTREYLKSNFSKADVVNKLVTNPVLMKKFDFDDESKQYHEWKTMLDESLPKHSGTTQRWMENHLPFAKHRNILYSAGFKDENIKWDSKASPAGVLTYPYGSYYNDENWGIQK